MLPPSVSTALTREDERVVAKGLAQSRETFEVGCELAIVFFPITGGAVVTGLAVVGSIALVKRLVDDAVEWKKELSGQGQPGAR